MVNTGLTFYISNLEITLVMSSCVMMTKDKRILKKVTSASEDKMACAALCLNLNGCELFGTRSICGYGKSHYLSIRSFPQKPGKRLWGNKKDRTSHKKPGVITTEKPPRETRSVRQLEESCEDSKGYRMVKFDKEGKQGRPMCLSFTHNIGGVVRWETANKTCTTQGARLVVIHSQMEYKTVKRIIKHGGGSFISLFQKQFKRGIWLGMKGNTWVDGSKKTFVKFARGLDKNPNNNLCLAMQFKDKHLMEYIRCESGNFFICQKI